MKRRKVRRAEQKRTVHLLINEMRFILDDNFVFDGPILFISAQLERIVNIGMFFFFLVHTESKMSLFS